MKGGGEGLYGRSLGDCVARRPVLRRLPTLSSTRTATRATIKAFPSPLRRPRPYGYPALLPLSLPSVEGSRCPAPPRAGASQVRLGRPIRGWVGAIPCGRPAGLPQHDGHPSKPCARTIF